MHGVKRTFFFQEEVRLFQLYMITLWNSKGSKLNRKEIQLILSGHGSNNLEKDIIDVHRIHDMDVAKEMGLYVENNENMNQDEDQWKHYEVPTIKCDTFEATSVIIPSSRITFFFVPHPNSTNNEIFFNYKYNIEKNIFLYMIVDVFSVVNHII